jgi:hypothetical protein
MYGASSWATTTVTVRPVSSQVAQAFVLSAINTSASSGISLSVINLLGTLLSKVNCSGSPNCATLYRNDLHEYGIKWRRGLNDDTIVSLDILKTGYWCTAENRAIGIGKIGTSRKGRLEGGMTDFYAQGGFMKKSAELVRLHPDCATTVVKFNRVHHVVDFSKFTQKLIPVNQDARPTKRTVTPTPAKKASTSPTTLAGCEYLTNLVANPETEVTYPVYIPSKGRANTGTTHKLLTEAGIPYTLVIEPQDVEA